MSALDFISLKTSLLLEMQPEEASSESHSWCQKVKHQRKLKVLELPAKNKC